MGSPMEGTLPAAADVAHSPSVLPEETFAKTLREILSSSTEATN